MSTAYDNLMTALLAGWRDATVATAAGVASATWSSADVTVGHVFGGMGGSIAGRNMGRLPFVEVEVTGTDWDGAMNDGGTLLAQVQAAVHVSGSNWQAASSGAYDIATTGLTALKASHLLRVGTVSINPLAAGPWGHVLPVDMSIELTYDESDFTHG